MKRFLAILLMVSMWAVSAVSAEQATVAVGAEVTSYQALQKGDTGDAVKALQTRLKELGYYGAKLSGKYLEVTRRAVMKFQQEHQLPETGVADAATQALIFSGADSPARAAEELLVDSEVFDLDDEVSADAEAVAQDGTLLPEEDDSTAAPTAAGATPDPQAVPFVKKLSRNVKGEAVKQVQQQLTDLGYYKGPVSGNYLDKTIRAVRKFQKQNGLNADGVTGEDTWNALFNSSDVVLPGNTPRPTPAPPPAPYAVTVDVRNQVTTVYELNADGSRGDIARQMLCSTGTKKNPSDVGDWKLNGRRARWCYFPKWGGHARYWTRINSGIAFHSVIYNAVDLKAVAVSSYKNLGRRVSHGCIRLTVEDAKWMYDHLTKGVVVTIREDLPADPELVASLRLPAWNKRAMQPEATPEPTARPVYVSNTLPAAGLTAMKKGETSEAVYWLQSRLTELGYYHGAVTGTYLGGTQAAVKAFQKANGLAANGSANVQTVKKLYEGVGVPTATATPEVLSTPEPTVAPTEAVVEPVVDEDDHSVNE